MTETISEYKPEATRSSSIGKLTEALSKAQGKFLHAKKDVQNEFFKKKYADLARVIDAAKEPLSANGLAVIQTTDYGADGKLLLTTVLSHISGEWIKGVYPINPVKNDPQGFGAAITYARRYSYSAIIGVASEDDDDANEASNKKVTAKARKERWSEIMFELNEVDNLEDLGILWISLTEELKDIKYRDDESYLKLFDRKEELKKSFAEKEEKENEENN